MQRRSLTSTERATGRFSILDVAFLFDHSVECLIVGKFSSVRNRETAGPANEVVQMPHLVKKCFGIEIDVVDVPGTSV
jgi:hypothetical protein